MKAIHADIACKRMDCDFRTCSNYEQFTGCQNIDINSGLCAEDEREQESMEFVLPTGLVVPSSSVCNGRCDVHYTCEDEAVCGSFTYGGFCEDRKIKNKLVYIKPSAMCHMDWHCVPGAFNCSLSGKETCKSLFTNVVVPILNRTRCGAPWGIKEDFVDKDKTTQTYICDNMADQTNCTDPNRYHRWAKEPMKIRFKV